MQTIDFTNASLKELGITEYTLSGYPESEADFNEMFRKITGENDDGRAIISDDPADFGITWSQLLTKRNELEAAEPLKLLREERNQRLTDTDWVVVKAQETGGTVSTEWQTYRQALRDITDTYSSLDTVVWPTKP